jgi:hypothetical protein
MTIPAGTYPNQDAPVTTIGGKALLIASRALPDRLVEDILDAMFGAIPDLMAHHQRASEISLRSAYRLEDGMSIGLHPAAERFYRIAAGGR